jgi:hypothetical protein
MVRSTRILTFGLCAVTVGCALPPWIGHRPVFPSGGPATWTIPLYEPLTSYGPKVIATVCGAAQAGKPRVCEEALLYVDTGSSHSALIEGTFARLGVETTGSRFATIEDAAGEMRAWSGAVLPEMRFGDILALTDVVAVVHRTAILGADVLTERAWRIDLDRGTLTLGARSAGAVSGATRLPIRGYPKRTIVDLAVEGRGVQLLVDTGAPITVIDAAWLRAQGLSLRALHHGWPLSARDPSVRLDEATDAVLRLGESDLGRRQLVAHPRGNDGPTRGMLGLDILSDFAYGVSDGALELARRAPSPFAGAPERVARWRGLPRCLGLPGCVTAQPEPAAGFRVRIRTAASSPGPWRYLFGCVDPNGQQSQLSIWIEIGVRAAEAGQERVVDVSMPEPMRQAFAAGCSGLALLDVNPVLAAERPLTADVEARFTFGNRRLRLD